MLGRTLIPFLNHLLAGESWARERLRGFGGQHLCLVGGPFTLALTVGKEGFLESGDSSTAGSPAVTIELPPDAPVRFINGGRESVFAAARLTGQADFAETLAFVFRNLRWDVEDDLSKVVGDIAARRIVRSASALLGWQRQAAERLATNVAEYLSEETAVIVPKRELERFRHELKAASEDLDRLGRRLAKL